MGSSTFDRYVGALSRGTRKLSRALPLVGSIQPTAQVAWGTEYLDEPLADRAFAAQVSDSNELGAVAVGRTGAAWLTTDTTIPGAAGTDAPPCWFWCQQVQGDSAPDFFGDIWLRPRSVITAITLLTGVFSSTNNEMGTQAKQLTATELHVTKLAPGVLFGLDKPLWRMRGLLGIASAPVTSQGPIIGPLFKPRGLDVIIAGFLPQTQQIVNWKWIELPEPGSPTG